MPAAISRWAMLLAAPALLLVAAPAAAHTVPTTHLGTQVSTQIAAACSSPIAPAPAASDEPWPQARYDLSAVHRVTQGAGVTVAVLDSGVDPSHPQLAGAVEGGGDELDPSGDGLEDCAGHGTAVASIIAARPVAGIAFRGVAPEATILSIRVGDRRQTEDGYIGTGDIAALVSGIEQAVDARPRPDVLNLSISTATDSPALRAAIRSALDADIVVVAAVGNLYGDGNPTPYPAAYDGVIGVGAISPNGSRWESSQVGAYVDLVAPGDGVLSAARVSGHGLVSGTSYATPFVAGTAALIRARWPELDRAEVVRRMLATADPPSGGQPSPDYGYGVVNPLRALTEVVPPAAAPPVAPSPDDVVEIARSSDTETTPPTRMFLIAGALLIGAAGVTILAAVTPAGRRRGWRPGRVDASPPIDDSTRTYLDDFRRPYERPGPAPPRR